MILSLGSGNNKRCKENYYCAWLWPLCCARLCCNILIFINLITNKQIKNKQKHHKFEQLGWLGEGDLEEKIELKVLFKSDHVEYELLNIFSSLFSLKFSIFFFWLTARCFHFFNFFLFSSNSIFRSSVDLLFCLLFIGTEN